jgi:branched-chain amino acid aminotransferase
MKVYRGYDSQLRLFRPDLNAARLDMSATRVTLPSFNTNEFVKLLKAFMKVDGPSQSIVLLHSAFLSLLTFSS